MHRGTNPKIKIEVNVDTSLIVDARVTLKQDAYVVKKKYAECTISEGFITTQLTEDDTLGLKAGKEVEIQAKVKLSDGTIACTNISKIYVKENLDEEKFDEVEEVQEEEVI